MANNVTNVAIGKPKITGAIWRAPLGTALPKDASTELSAEFKCLGYVSDDGFKQETKRDSDASKAWGGDTVARPQTDFDDTFSATLIEITNAETLKAVFGDDNVTVDESGKTISIDVKSDDLPFATYVIDIALSNKALKRIVYASAKPTEIGEITYNDSDPVGYEATFGAIASADLGGATHREYIKLA